jgi:hypothetical protein
LILAIFSTSSLQAAGISFGPFNIEFNSGFNEASVKDVRVVEDSHFEAPKDIAIIFKHDISQVVCQVAAQQDD